jgi:hypothetical protein
MTIKTFLAIILTSIFGCRDMNFENKAVINGNIPSIKNGKIYLE